MIGAPRSDGDRSLRRAGAVLRYSGLGKSRSSPAFHASGFDHRRSGSAGDGISRRASTTTWCVHADEAPRFTAATHGPTVQPMAQPTRWVTDTKDGHSAWYIERFRKKAAEGEDLAGEARMVDAMVARGARILDGGCGPGRVGAELHARGHRVVGVDADPALIAAAEEDHPGPRWLVADLSELDLAAQGETEPFDLAVLAGNVMVFLAPGTEADALRRVAAHLVPDGRVVTGFHVNRELSLDAFDRAVADAGLEVEHRFATWDLRAWHDDADFAVTVLRHAR